MYWTSFCMTMEEQLTACKQPNQLQAHFDDISRKSNNGADELVPNGTGDNVHITLFC
jgi:hypothetical protein